MIPALLLGAAAARAVTLTHEVQIDLSEIRGTVKEYAGEEFMVFEPKTLDLTSEEGKPKLPVKYIRLAVPTYASNFRVSTQSVPSAESNISYRIFPCQKPIQSDFEGTIEFNLPDSTFYSQDEWTPVVKYADNGYLEGNRQIVTIGVYPVSYNPYRSETRIYSKINIRLDYDIVAATDLHVKPINTASGLYLSSIWQIVDNPIEADNIYLPADGSVKKHDNLYYIISPRNLVDAFAELAAWKSQKGYNVKLIAIEDIIDGPLDAGYDPLSAIQDDASKLRQYLRKEFENNGSFYVLLGGDYTNMPIFCVNIDSGVYIDKTWNNKYLVPTDHYFSDFNSVWDINQYQQYSTSYFSNNNTEIDFCPEIYVGRILCHDERHVRNYIKKLLRYEAYPGNGDTEYLKRAFMTSYYQMIPGATAVRENYESIGLFDPQTSCYMEDTGNHYPKGIDVINAMKSRYGYFSWHGHGDQCRISVSSSWEPNITEPFDCAISSCDLTTWWMDKPHGLTGLNRIENARYPAIAYSMACTTAPFDRLIYNGTVSPGLKMCDSFTIEGEYGGPAYLGNTRYGWIDTSFRLEKDFNNQLMVSPNIGVAESLSKINCSVGKHLKLTHNLIGEPEFPMWTVIPEKLNVEVEFNPRNIEITGDNIDDAVISLIDANNSLIRKMYTGYSKTISIAGVSSKNPVVSIWKDNYLPYMIWKPQNETLINKRRFVKVNQTVLGGESKEKDGGLFVIGEDASVKIDVLENILLNNGLRIADNGVLEIWSLAPVEVKGTNVTDKGYLEISAPQTVFEKGFNINKGASMQINVVKDN